MNLPPNVTEEQFVEELKRVISTLINKIQSYGYYTREDMVQEAYTAGIEAISKNTYNSEKSLGAYLRTSIVHHFINLYRNKFTRNESPCTSCVFYDKMCKKSDNQCVAFTDKMNCKKFKRYFDRNKTKRDLMNLKASMDVISSSPSFSACELKNYEDREYIEWLMTKLKESNKKRLKSLLNGDSLKQKDIELLQKAVLKALEGRDVGT